MIIRSLMHERKANEVMKGKEVDAFGFHNAYPWRYEQR